MSEQKLPRFHNNFGQKSIHIGSQKFICIGATPPLDHPHVYLVMGKNGQKTCPYCSVVYKFDPNLKNSESYPPNSFWIPCTS